MHPDDLDTLILQHMPDFLSLSYQHLLDARRPQERVERALHMYNLALRTLTIIVVSQYLLHDRHDVSDPGLNELLLRKFPNLTLDAWQEILFATLEAYEGKRAILFVPELYDVYWSTESEPHAPRRDVVETFTRLTGRALGKSSNKEQPQDTREWAERAAEVDDLLRRILRNLTFFTKYDLIRVVDVAEQDFAFDAHKGHSVTTQRAPIPAGVVPTIGWSYLRSATGELLLLHPLFVFWEKGSSNAITSTSEVGVYDRFFYEQLRYLLALSDTTVLDTNGLQAFVSLLYDTIENVKRRRRESERLTWRQLRENCADITGKRMATVSGKYRKDIYLRREKTHREFVNFLASEQRCFVLIGKSGVGKSNFLLAMDEELSTTRNDICMLMYDGAHLQTDISISQAITQDFNDRLTVGGQLVSEIWHEIAKIDGIDKRSVILCVDAINENGQASEVLRQLDQLVQQPWPWLKIVFTSRPETWQAIRRGVKLAEALYYQESPETLGVSLDPFSYSQRMESFSRQELPRAYAKYQEVYRLQTDYQELPAHLKEILCEPLNLWLVAASYERQRVPLNLRLSTLVEQYLLALIQTGRLDHEDLRFLEKRLVPLMATHQRYNNYVTALDLDTAADGLYEAVYSEQRMSDGRKLNESFLRLVDADILVRQELRRDQRVAFKYERFYEYFIGNKIFEISKVHSDQYAYFVGMTERTTELPFLWGAVRNALAAFGAANGAKMLLKLCYTEQQRTKDLMVDTLTILGADEPAQIDLVLNNLIPPRGMTTSIGRVFNLFVRQNSRSDGRTRNARKIAIEVASNLGAQRTLQAAFLQPDPSTRTSAVRQAYLLWRRDHEAGFEVLDHLVKVATPGVIPDLIALESALGLSFVIYFDYLHDAVVVNRLQSIWRPAIARLLSIHESSSEVGTWLSSAIRQRIYGVAMSVAFRLLRDMGETGTISASGLESFFHLPLEQKRLYRRLTRYLDVDGSYTVEEMERDFVSALSVRNILVETIAGQGQTAHLARNPSAFLPIMKRLFAVVERDPVPGVWRSNIAFNVMAVLERDPAHDEMFDFFVYTVERSQEYYSEGDNAKIRRTSESPHTMYMDPYILFQYQRTGSINAPWLVKRIESALAADDMAFFRSYILTHLGIVGVGKRKPRVALDALELVFHTGIHEVDQMAASFLARLRLYYPDEVDAFLEEQRASESYQLQVRTSEPVETVGQLIGLKSYSFLMDDVILGSSDLLQQYLAILAKAAESNNLHAWVEYMIPEIVNRIYGGEALRPH